MTPNSLLLGSYLCYRAYSQCLSCNPSPSLPSASPAPGLPPPHPSSCPAVCQGKARCAGAAELSSKAPRACPECPTTQMPQSSGSETPGPTSSESHRLLVFTRLHTMMKPSLKVDVAWLAWAAGGEGRESTDGAAHPHHSRRSK